MTTITESWGRPLVTTMLPATTIRSIRPADLGLIHEMHQRLSPESIYYRYFQCRVPAWEELAVVCQLPPQSGEALVATLNGDEERIIGLAYYVREKTAHLPTAELGILVEDQFQGQGIGRKLWQQLHHLAQVRQIRRLRVLSDPRNQRIQHLIQGSGYAYRSSTDYDLNEFIVFLAQPPQPTSALQRFGKFSFFTLFLLFSLLAAQMFYSSVAQAAQRNQSMVDSTPAADDPQEAIAYVGPSRDNQQIRLINPDGSNNRLLWQVPTDTARVNGIGELSWRSDAGELAFDSGHDWQRSLYTRDIYGVATNSAKLRRLTRPPSAGDGAHPTGTVTFWLSSYASGDVQLYIEGADKPISFPAKLGYAYQITQTVADLGDNVRQFIRLYDPNDLTPNWCNYNEEAWVDVVAGQTTDAGTIRFGVADDYTCSQAIRPAWTQNGNNLLFLAAEATQLSFQEENNIWQIAADAPPTSPGTRLLNYSQYLLEGRVFLAKPGPTEDTADQLLAAVQEDAGHSSIFQAPIADAGQREFFDLGACNLTCLVTGLAWLPDGSGFVFARYEEWIGTSKIESGGAIYRYTFADHQVALLYQVADQTIGRLDLAPNGNQIVYEQSQQLDKTTANFWLEPLLLCPCQIWIVNSDGANAHLLVDDGRTPVWSPVPLPTNPLPAPVPQQLGPKIFMPFVQK